MNKPHIAFAILCIVTSAGCLQVKEDSPCGPDSRLAGDGYSYVEKGRPAASGAPYGRFMDSLSRRDSFYAAYAERYCLDAYREPILGVGPSDKTTIRISFDEFSGENFILRANCDSIVLKVKTAGVPYPDYKEDTARLTSLERRHYWLLKRDYPLGQGDRPARWKKWWDSLIHIYPELSSPAYFRSLLEKSVDPDSLKFSYTEYRAAMGAGRLKGFMAKLDSAGFWTLPFRNSSKMDVTDGGGFILEVHTPKHYKVLAVSNYPRNVAAVMKVCREMMELIRPGDKIVHVFDSDRIFEK